MSSPSVYIEREGRQFGLETRVRVKSDGKMVYGLDSLFFTFPVLRARLWGLLHGYGWLVVE